MTDSVRRSGRTGNAAALERKPTAPQTAKASSDRAHGDAEAERALARRVAVGAPALTIATAAVVGAFASVGPAILVLAGGALFATITFFWASLRTLGGEAPLAEGFDRMTRRAIDAGNGTAVRKRAALRALKDLEFEHEVGKIDDDDYAKLSAIYRDQAKAILREMEEEVVPLRERAEKIALAYLAKRGLSGTAPERAPLSRGSKGAIAALRKTCRECSASNEPDAQFCKGCGAKLALDGCPKCSTVNEPDAAFCKRCGGPLAPSVTENADESA